MGGSMIIYDINDIYRKQIYGKSQDKLVSFLSNFEIKKQRSYLKLILSDAYIGLSSVNFFNTISNEEECILYEWLNKISCNEAISDMEKFNPILESIYSYGKNFYNLSFLEKCYCINNLIPSIDYKRWQMFNPLFLIDIFTYTASKDILSMNEYYKDYVQIYKKNQIEIFPSLVSYYLLPLQKDNKNLWDANMLEILKQIYVNQKFMASHFGKISDRGLFIDMLENKPLDSIKEEIGNSQEQFEYMLSKYFFYVNDTICDKQEIKNFAHNFINEKMKQKLKIKP